MRDRPARQGTAGRAGPGPGRGPAGAGPVERGATRMPGETIVGTVSRSCPWCRASVPPGAGDKRPSAGPGRAEVSVPLVLRAAVRRPGARPGPGKWPPGRVPGRYSRVSGPAPATGAWCVAARSGGRGLAELADDVVVVAVAEDARLVRLTVYDVIDHDGQVFIRLGAPGPGPRTRCRHADQAGCQPREHEHRRQRRLPVAVSPADAPTSPSPQATLVQQFRAPGIAPPRPAPGHFASSSCRPRSSRRACPRLQPGNRHLPPHRHRPNLAPLPATRAGS